MCAGHLAPVFRGSTGDAGCAGSGERPPEGIAILP